MDDVSAQTGGALYVKVKGKWTYLYRAVDRDGKTVDFMLSKKRDGKSARRFFKKAIAQNGSPEKVAIDKSGANLAALQWVNVIQKFKKDLPMINIRQNKYLNNIVEQDHRFIKRKIRPMMGFKTFETASATLQGIEVSHMVRKGQIGFKGQSVFDIFAKLTA